MPNAENGTNVVVPGKTMVEIGKLLSGSADDLVEISITDKYIFFEMGTCSVVSLVIDDKFIAHNKFFEQEHTTSTKISRAEFIMCLERAKLMANESNKSTMVKFDIGNNSVTITSDSQKGNVYDEMAMEVEGKDLSIAFNTHYFIEALKAIEDDKVAITFSNAMSPCIIRPVNEGNYEYLILPLRKTA